MSRPSDVTNMRSAIKHFDGDLEAALELLDRCRVILGWVEEWAILLFPDRAVVGEGSVTLTYDGEGWNIVNILSEARQ